MTNRNLTLIINPEECVGDSLAKHNFNFLSLDSVTCNLSSLFFSKLNNSIPLNDTFNDFNSNINLYQNNLTEMVNPSRYDRAYTGVNLLSSYWSKQELTVQIEYNKNTGDNTSLMTNSANPTFLSRIITNCDNYITSNNRYPLSSYPEGTIINVIYPIFENDGEIIKRYRTNLVNEETTLEENSQLPSFTNTLKSISAYFTKNDNNIHSIPSFSFQKKNNDWVFVKTLSSTNCPKIKMPEVLTTNITKPAAVGNIVVKPGDSCEPLAFNVWYPAYNFYSAQAYCLGQNDETSPNSIGTLTLLLKTPDGRINKTFPKKASGKNGKTNSYLKWTVQTADGKEAVLSFETSKYVTFPDETDFSVEKDLGKLLINNQDLDFMFTKDTKGILYEVCGTRKTYTAV